MRTYVLLHRLNYAIMRRTLPEQGKNGKDNGGEGGDLMKEEKNIVNFLKERIVL